MWLQMALVENAACSLVVSLRLSPLNVEGCHPSPGKLSTTSRDVVSRHSGGLPMEKLSVYLWGMSISAEGLWAIAAAIVIVGIIAAVVAFRRA